MSAPSLWHTFFGPHPSVSFPAAPQPTLLQPSSMHCYSCFPFFRNVPPGPLSTFLNFYEASHMVCFILQISMLSVALVLFPALTLWVFSASWGFPASLNSFWGLSDLANCSCLLLVSLLVFTCHLWQIFQRFPKGSWNLALVFLSTFSPLKQE